MNVWLIRSDFDIGPHCFHFCYILTFPWSRHEDYPSCIEFLYCGLRKTLENYCVKHDSIAAARKKKTRIETVRQDCRWI